MSPTTLDAIASLILVISTYGLFIYQTVLLRRIAKNTTKKV